MLTTWIPPRLSHHVRARRPGAARRRAPAFRPRLEALEDRAVPALMIWDGGHPRSNNWSEPLNWVGDTAPQAGDDLEFPAVAARKANFNNFPSGTSFRSLRFTGSGYTISGGPFNEISIGDLGILDIASGTNSYNGPIRTDQPSSLHVHVDEGGALQLGGALGGTGGLEKVSPGTLTLTGPDANTYAGETHVNGGRLLLDKGDASGPRIAIPSRTVGILSSDLGARTVKLLRDDQIADHATVFAAVGSEGEDARLDLNGFSDTIQSLHLTGGSVLIPQPSVLTLNGDVTAQGTFKSFLLLADIFGGGTLALGANPCTFTVNPTPGSSGSGANVDLGVSVAISGSVLVKEGAGTMQMHDSTARVEVNAGAVLARPDNSVNPAAQPSVILRNDGRLGGEGSVTGSVTTQGGSIQTLDDGSPGFTAIGWIPTSLSLGFGGDVTVSPKTASTATWAFTGLTPGLYRVFASWPFDPDPAHAAFNLSHSTAAPYSIFDDTTLRATAVVDQEKAPVGGPRAGGVVFQQLAGTVNVTSDTMKVQLSNRVPAELDSSSVVADAVRIERLAGVANPGFHTGAGFSSSVLHLGSAALGHGSTYRVFFKTNGVVNLADVLTVDGSFLASSALLELVADSAFHSVGFTPPGPGTAYRIITTGSFIGSFSNLPHNGDTIQLVDGSGQRHNFTINYAAGDGNDIDLVYQSTPPQVSELSLSPGVVNEGQRVTLRGALTDPDRGDVLSLRVDWGDGTVQTFRDLGTKPFHFTHAYADNSPPGLPYLVRVEWFDQHGGGNSRKLFVTVKNVPPRLFLGSAEVIGAGEVMHHTGHFTDPGADTWRAAVNYGDGSGVHPLAIQPGQKLSFEHRYKRPGTYRVTVTVFDDDGGMTTGTFLAIVPLACESS